MSEANLNEQMYGQLMETTQQVLTAAEFSCSSPYLIPNIDLEQ